MFYKRLSIGAMIPWMFTLTIVFLFFFNISFDAVCFKADNTIYYKIFLVVVASLPLMYLFDFAYFREQLVRKKLLILSLVSLLITLNFVSHTSFLFSIVFGVVVLINFLYDKKIYRPQVFHWLLLIYFAVNALSLLWTKNLNEGLKLLGNISPLVYIPLFFCFFKLNESDFKLIMLMMFRLALFYAFYSVVSWIVTCNACHYAVFPWYISAESTNGFDPVYAFAFGWTNHAHPTYNGFIMLLGLAIGWYYILKREVANKAIFTELIFLIITTFLIAVFTDSRYMQLVWLIVNVSGFLYNIRNKKKLLVVSLFVFAVTAALGVYFFHTKINAFFNDPIRHSLYQAAFQSIHDNTYRGTGLGGMTQYINEDNPFFWRHVKGTPFTLKHPHNQVVGDLMQAGILGLISILSIIVYLFYLSYRKRNWLLFIAFLLFFCLMNIESPLVLVRGIFTFALVFCLMVAKPDVKTVNNRKEI
ncbi:MAG: hypothetical protein H6Q20_2281 [Bacteroidetes bacterium]|nr:hypothetical protein [Bacteroidota bacterium]